jgi:hypothetical protein
LLNEVTLISTIHCVAGGVLVIVILVVAFDVEAMVVEKNGAGFVPSSFLAFTSILTPPGGMVDVIVIVKLNGPFDGAGVWPIGGFVVTTKLASEPPPFPPPPFLQPEEMRTELTKNNDNKWKTNFINFIRLTK